MALWQWGWLGAGRFTDIKGDHFLLSGWNLFDAFVVAVSIPSMARVPLPPPASNLRIFRAFRVFRLFKRVKSLNKILVSLANAVPGIINAAMCAAPLFAPALMCASAHCSACQVPRPC